jgi:hypothetical protein
MAWTYADCEAALATARCRDAGKPIASSTRVFARADHLAIQHYSTDIIRFYPDGRMAICTGWTTTTTLKRIRQYAGKWVGKQRLPAFNGRLSDTLSHHAVGGFVFKGFDGYVYFGADKKVDPATVKPINVQIITDAKAIRPAQKRIKELVAQVALRQKMGIVGSRHENTRRFLQTNLDRAMEHVDYSTAPTQLGLGNVTPIWIAELVGATKTIQFKEFASC